MNATRPFPRLLPHEWCFGGFLLLTWLRLLAAVGPLDPSALLYLFLLLGGTVLTARCLAQPTKARWYARLWYYPVIMNVAFVTMGTTALKLVPHRQDAFLQQMDAALAGVTPSLQAQAIVSPWLTETLSFCYLLFFPYLLLSLGYYAWRGLPVFRQLTVGLFTIYAFGFLGYTLLPAVGPYLAIQDQFTVPLTGFAVTRLNNFVVVHGTNGVDVFPSLHCAVSCFLLGFDRQHARWRFRLFLVPCCGLCLATIYLRYHYLTDVLVGFGLATLALWLTGRGTQHATASGGNRVFSNHQPETNP